MSQDPKNRTMIGTRAPIPQPRATQPGVATPATHPPPPTRVANASAPIVAPPSPSAPYPAQPPAQPPMAATITGTPSAPVTAPPVPVPGPRPSSPGAAATVGLGPRGEPSQVPGASTPSQMPGGVAGLPGDADAFIGQELCGYTIRRKLAEGGMGVVYEGVHSKIGRTGAIKVLKLEFCRSEDVVERFYQEARAVNSIRHENIVDIYDFGRDPFGRVYFVMEYLEGEPLSARIRRGALAWGEALPILDQTLRALKAAHDKGFVHRDLKPDNIWLQYVDGRVQVKLLDFGIAKLVGTDSPKEKLTQTGSVIGTPHYMSPEQINGSRDIDHRTDIYAMGVITYEMFAGVTPFGGETLQAVMTGHLFMEPPRLADIPAQLGVPAPIAEIVDRMLVKDATGRYASVTDVLSDLYDVGRNQWPTHAETLNRVRPARTLAMPGMVPVAPAKPAPKRGRALAIVGAVAVAGAAIAGVAIWQSRSAAVATTSTEARDTTSTPTPAPVPGPNKPAPPAPPAPTAPPAIDYDAARKEAQTTLRAALREPEPAVRAQGSDALGTIKDRPSIPQLTELTERDPDQEVRGKSGAALGAIGATEAAPVLAKLEAAAPPPLRVWYTTALARLGDKAARGRLAGHARSKDLAVAFRAGLALSELSSPGDKQALAALRGLIRREAELNDIVPQVGADLLGRMALLRDPDARKQLTSLLESSDEGVRVAAAAALARIGDDAGKQILRDVAANTASPNRLRAAIAQIPLGEYGGVDALNQALLEPNAAKQSLAARGLGDIGQPASLPALMKLAQDKDWTVRIAAATAVVAIVGLDPQVLAQASVDWTRAALDSSDLSVRRAAAGVLADIPAKDAAPLLAQAILDKDPEVRRNASRSAGKIKTPEAAAKVAEAVKAEKDPGVREQQVKALGEIGEVGAAAARDTLAALSDEPGRIGVLAAGSLIAVGDTAASVKLEAAVAPKQPEVMRLAAVEAATTANNQVVVPTLKLGILDRVFNIRFTAALGLVGLGAERDAAVPVLNAALDSKDAGIVGRAIAALTKLGEKIKDTVRSPAEMLDSPDPRDRLAVIPIARTLAPGETAPLLRRLVSDTDQSVRRAGVDAIEDLAARDKDQAIRLYKPLVADLDPFVRSKALGQLARIAPKLPEPQVITQVKPQDEVRAPAPPPPPPPLDPKLTEAHGAAQRAAEGATTAAAELEAVLDEVDKLAANQSREDRFERAGQLRARIAAAEAALDAAVRTTDESGKAVSDLAGATPAADAGKLVAAAAGLAKDAATRADAARAKVAAARKKLDELIKTEAPNVNVELDGIRTDLDMKRFAPAKKRLDDTAALLRKAGERNASLDDLYSRAYYGLALAASDPAAKRRLLVSAQGACERFIRAGGGRLKELAKERLAEINEELAKLAP